MDGGGVFAPLAREVDQAVTLLPPTEHMAFDPKRVFSLEVAIIVTIVLSVALVLYVLVLIFEG
jgi:hypothetical protein